MEDRCAEQVARMEETKNYS